MSALTFLANWRLISARIHGLEKAAAVHAGFLKVSSGSPYGADKDLQKHCSDVYSNILQLRDTFRNTMPSAANTAIEHFMADGGKQIRDNAGGDALLVRTSLVKLVAFESEMTFYLDNPLERVRSTSELAFMHLQRLIVADPEYRDKWQRAFDDGEIRCEKLGAIHLLWHGIWAFKVDAAGGKTDLVYQEPSSAETSPVALGIILTEWKLGRSDPDSSFAEAKQQAAQYAGGVLAGVELASHRYLVVITKKQIITPVDIVDRGVTYRHINIAVDPDVPSLAAKKIAQ